MLGGYSSFSWKETTREELKMPTSNQRRLLY